MTANSNFFLVDVRSPEETAEGIIPGALCIPVDEIAERKEEIPKTGQPVLVYCAGGGRSLGVCEELSHAGFERLHNLQGGFMGWTGEVVKPS
jgi:rhodanese-related sulfurtransferase